MKLEVSRVEQFCRSNDIFFFFFLEHAPLMNTGGAKGRGATPEEIAGCVGMLCLPDSFWCTGSVVSCNGGMLMGL